jgi:PAS domain S-box-containing protein
VTTESHSPASLGATPDLVARSVALALLFEASFNALGTLSHEGFFTMLNPASETVFGCSRKELTALPMVAFAHPDDVGRTTTMLATLDGSHPSIVDEFEIRWRATDGTYRWISWRLGATTAAIYVVAKDVSLRRANEVDRDEAMSLKDAIINNVVDGLCVVDCTGVITWINPAGVEMLDYPSAEALIGLSSHATFHHSRRNGTPYPERECPMTQVRSDGVTVQVDEDTFWRRDGSAVPVSYSAAAIQLGASLGSIVVFRDISAQQVERARVRANVGEIAWFEEVRQSLERDRFVLYSQPIVDVTSGATVKHELLLRMLDLAGRVLAPAHFLPSAEKFGLIGKVDRWVVLQAVTLAAQGESIAVNLSAASIGDRATLHFIEREIANSHADPTRLTFELTETAVMTDIKAGRRFAEALVDLGCTFALDDFGTGYGSLTYLRELPITYLKIDVQFVRNMAQSARDRSLVRTIVSIAKNLDKLTIAEGIEDRPTFEMLADLEVDFAQGFYLGEPVEHPSNPPHVRAADDQPAA